MASSYPTTPDVLPVLVDELDRPRASWANRLTDGFYQATVELGLDPFALGTGYSTYTDGADLLSRFALMEMGRFDVEYPADDPVHVPFQNPARFVGVTLAQVAVFVMSIRDRKGRRIGENYRWNTVPLASGADPDGFDFYRRNMSAGADFDEEFWYLVLADDL